MLLRAIMDEVEQSTFAPSRLWVVPNNDGEAVEILRLLRERGERVLESHQRWGASWSKLEPRIQRELADSVGVPIFGVELEGPNPYGASNIDHHRYSGDDRSHPLSSVEQVAGIVGVQLDRWRTLVAINDRGYIPGLERFGASAEEIALVRAQDRDAQGLTAIHRERAQRDITAAEWSGRRAAVRCPDGSTSWHSDLLYPIADEWLLMGPATWSYSGPRHLKFTALELPEHTWTGGAEDRGYFGIETPSQRSQDNIRALFFG